MKVKAVVSHTRAAVYVKPKGKPWREFSGVDVEFSKQRIDLDAWSANEVSRALRQMRAAGEV